MDHDIGDTYWYLSSRHGGINDCADREKWWVVNFLLMGNGLVSVVGLCFDAFGFWMLARDLLPEYHLNQAVRAVNDKDKMLDAAIVKFEFTKTQIEKTQREQLEKFDALGQKLDEARVPLNSAERQTYNATLAEVSSKVASINEKLSGYGADVERHREISVSAHQTLKQAEEGLIGRVRLPIRVAIGFVIVGFIFQAWGSIPVPLQSPVSVDVEAGGAVTIEFHDVPK